MLFQMLIWILISNRQVECASSSIGMKTRLQFICWIYLGLAFLRGIKGEIPRTPAICPNFMSLKYFLLVLNVLLCIPSQYIFVILNKLLTYFKNICFPVLVTGGLINLLYTLHLHWYPLMSAFIFNKNSCVIFYIRACFEKKMEQSLLNQSHMGFFSHWPLKPQNPQKAVFSIKLIQEWILTCMHGVWYK